MDEYLFKNNAKSTLASGITSGQLTLSVKAGEGALFPNPTGNEYFLTTLVDTSGNREIVKVTARATDDFTIVRAQEGTIARAFLADDKVELRLTAGWIQATTDELTGLKDGTRADPIDLNGKKLILDADGDTSITADTDDQIDIEIGGSDIIRVTPTLIQPVVNDSVSLGDTTHFLDKVFAGPVILKEQGSAPATPADAGAVYTKQVNGEAELFYRMESSGAEVMLTDRGEPALPPGWLYGMKIRNDPVDLSHDIEIAAGKCRDSSDSVNMILSSVLTKRIDAAWAVGDNNGGRFDSTLVANRTYHVFVIRNDINGQLDAGFSEDVDPTVNLPANYTEYRRIGSVRVNPSSNIVQFVQEGNWFYYTNPPLDLDNVSVGTGGTLVTLSHAPAGIKTRVVFNTDYAAQVSGDLMYIRKHQDVNSEAPSVQNAPLSCFYAPTAGEQPYEHKAWTDTQQRIHFRSSRTGGINLATLGYMDRRDQDGQ